MNPAGASGAASTDTKAGAPDQAQRQPMHDDPAKVRSFVLDRVQRDVKANTARRARDRADLQNLQFYRGGEDNQWTVWDAQAQTYVPRPSKANDEGALPEWFFRATTNLFAVKIDGVASIMNQSEPAQEIGPATDREEDRAAAEIAEAAMPMLLEEAGYQQIRPQINKLAALTNGVGVHVYYDTDERHGMDALPVLQCQNPECRQFHMPHDVDDDNVCPECGQPAVADAFFPPESQQAGQPVTVDAPRGKLCTRTLTSFEWSIPRSARELHEERVPWVAGHSRMDPQDIVAIWPEAKPKLDEFQTKNAAVGKSTSVAYADQMRALSSPGAEENNTGANGSSVSPSGPVVWMVWADPVDDDEFYFPEGLYVAMLETELVLEQGPLPLKDDKGRPVKNVILRTFQATPGSGWGKPVADDLVPLQKQLNLCQALAFLILMHDAAPTTFIPDTVTLLEDLSGVPGATVPFKSIRGGDKPIISGGQGFPDALKWFLEYLEKQFDVVSKLNAVLSGERPQGDPTLGEVQELRERGLAMFKEPLEQLVDFEKRLSLLLLWTARQSMWSPRFYSVAGDNGKWEVKQFLGADIAGSVQIHVEPASAWPPSQLLTNLRLKQAIETGFINPQDPEAADEYLSMNDLTQFKKSADDDRRQIARQLDSWKVATDPTQIGQPDPLWNLKAHFFHKVNWLKTEDAEALAAQNPPVYAAIRQHVEAIQTLMMPPPAPAPPGAPGPPDGKVLDAAMQHGALRPASGPKKPNGQALEAALQHGAIRPAGATAALDTHHAARGHAPSVNDLMTRRGGSKPAGRSARKGAAS